MALPPTPISLVLDKALRRSNEKFNCLIRGTETGDTMQSAQLQQEIDPAEVGIMTGRGERGPGYGVMSQDIFARIGVWLYELTRGSPSASKTTVRPSTMRTSLGRGLLRIFVAVVLAVGLAGGALAWEWPRSETVRH